MEDYQVLALMVTIRRVSERNREDTPEMLLMYAVSDLRWVKEEFRKFEKTFQSLTEPQNG